MVATTKKKRSPRTARARANGPPQRIRMMPLETLIPTADNRRKPFSDRSVRSLARSLKSEGMLQPIVARPHPDKPGYFEIRAGNRRWRAARLIGLKTVPVIVRQLDDPSALVVTVTENLHREDLHPLEEAEEIQLALEREHDIKALASRLGKSVAYVARRASLTRLAPVWRTLIGRPNSDASRLSAAHLELIARLPPETQELIADDEGRVVFGHGFPSVNDLQRIIDADLRSLSAMAWDLKDETLDPKAGSCLNCEKRSGKQRYLFDEGDAPRNGRIAGTDRCLDPRCFTRKELAHVMRCEASLRAEHPQLRLLRIGMERISPELEEKFGDVLERVYAPNFVRAGAKGAVPAMPVHGPRAGKLVYVETREPTTSATGATRRARDENGKVIPLSLAERRERHQRRRDAYVVKRVGALLEEIKPEELRKVAAAGRKKADGEGFDPIGLTLAFGSTRRADGSAHANAWAEYDQALKQDEEERRAGVLSDVLQIWKRRLVMHGLENIGVQAYEARRVSAILGFDYENLVREAVAELPEPKAWAELSEESDRRSKRVRGDVPRRKPAGARAKN